MGLALGPCTVPHAGKPSFELGEDEIAVNHLRVDLAEGETVTLKPLLPEKFKDATLSWGLEYDGVAILKAADDGKSATSYRR